MTQLINKTRILAARLGLPPAEVAIIARLPPEEMQKVFRAMCRASISMLKAKPSSNNVPKITDNPSTQSFFDQLRKKLIEDIHKRRKAERKLKTARMKLYIDMGKERAEHKGLTMHLPSSVHDNSKPRLVWNETDFERWIHREIDPNPRILTPSSTNIELDKTRSKPKCRISLADDPNYIKHRVLHSKMKKPHHKMHQAADPRWALPKEMFATDSGKKSAKAKKQEKAKKPVDRYRVVKNYLAEQGRKDQVESLERQKETMEDSHFSTRLHVVAEDCFKEVDGFSQHMLDNAWAIKKRLKKRAREAKRWRECRADDAKGPFPGRAAGRPSNLRISTSVDSLKDEKVDESTKVELPWDNKVSKKECWGVEYPNLD